MCIDYSYKDVEYCNRIIHKTSECFCDGNIIIPDSMDDVAKILHLAAEAHITDCKTFDGRIDVSGSVRFHVLYISESDNEKICSLFVNQTFSHPIIAEGIDNTFSSSVNISSISTTYSAVNSRRLKATAAIRFCAISYTNKHLRTLSQVTSAEFKTKNCTFLASRVAMNKNFIVADTVELPAGKNAICEILSRCAKIASYEFKLLPNKVIIKGVISLSVLYSTSTTPSEAEVSLPFTEVVEIDGITPNLDAFVSLSVSECDIRPDTDLSGEYKMLDVSIIVNTSVTAFSADTANVITDLYLPHGALKTACAPARVTERWENVTEEEFIKETISLPKGTSIGRILDISCTITDISVSSSSISATAEVNIIYLDGSTSHFNSYTTGITLEHKTSLSSIICPLVCISRTSYAITNDDTIELRIPAIFSFMSINDEEINVICGCEECTYTPEKRASIIVSVVNEGDSLWDIAKKHNISQKQLALANAIEENAILTVGDKLIIPR